jgi:uncharacterized protein YnzC (UPF0291/DUF896 family)
MTDTLKEHLSRIAKLSWKKQTEGKTKEEISKMMSLRRKNYDTRSKKA